MSRLSYSGVNNELAVKEDVGLTCPNASRNGSVPTAVSDYVTVEEQGDGIFHKTVFTLTNCPVDVVSTATNAIGFGGVNLYTWPTGRFRVLGAAASLTMDIGDDQTGYVTDATPEGDFGVGTDIVDTAQALGSSDTDDDNIVGATAFTMAAYAVATAVTGDNDQDVVIHDNSAGTLDCALNVVLDAGEQGNETVQIDVSGTITVTWVDVASF